MTATMTSMSMNLSMSLWAPRLGALLSVRYMTVEEVQNGADTDH